MFFSLALHKIISPPYYSYIPKKNDQIYDKYNILHLTCHTFLDLASILHFFSRHLSWPLLTFIFSVWWLITISSSSTMTSSTSTAFLLWTIPFLFLLQIKFCSQCLFNRFLFWFLQFFFMCLQKIREFFYDHGIQVLGLFNGNNIIEFWIYGS